MTATAIVASIGNGHDFKNGRQFSAAGANTKTTKFRGKHG